MIKKEYKKMKNKLLTTLLKLFRHILKLFRVFTRNKIAIDLGTANTLIYCINDGIIINEPSVVAVREVDGELVVEAVGENAKKMLGRAPDKMQIVRPLQNGVISNFDLAHMMLKGFLEKSFDGSIGLLPKKIIIGTPSGATSVEKRAIKECVEGDVELIAEPLAAAIGAKLPINQATGSMVIDIGGGTTEIAILSLGGIVTFKSCKIAGDAMDDAIITTIKKTYGITIGYTTAELIKKTLGCALMLDLPNESMEIKGKDCISGMPKSLVIFREQICNCLQETLSKIIEEVKATLSNVQADLSADIMNKGIKITGGGALLKNINILFSNFLEINVDIAENPLYSVIEGLAEVLKDKNVTKISFN